MNVFHNKHCVYVCETIKICMYLSTNVLLDISENTLC